MATEPVLDRSRRVPWVAAPSGTIAPADDRCLRLKSAAKFLGISVDSIAVHRRNGNFPPAVRLTQQAIGWPISQLIKWRDSQPRVA